MEIPLSLDDPDVDVVGDGPPDAVPGVAGDETEYSSSFAGSFSDPDDGAMPDSSDLEAESNAPQGGKSERLFRKKKVTEHWRSYINPLLWRSRWLELRIRELLNQAAKYDRELALYNHEKQFQMAMTSHDKCAAREIPFTSRSRVKAMKRRKRKKMEDTVDISSYMSQHVLFTYYDKKPVLEANPGNDGHDNQAQLDSLNQDDLGLNFEWPTNASEDDKCLEQILLDLETVQARVVDLRSQLRLVISNDAGEALSAPVPSFPGENHHSPSLSPKCSPADSREKMPLPPVNTSRCLSDSEHEEMVMPGSALSSYGDAGFSDVIESTRDLLSSAISRHEISNLANEASDDILINNQPANEELHYFERVTHRSGKPSQMKVKKEEDENIAREVSSSETESDVPGASSLQQALPIFKRCAGINGRLRRSKRKRRTRPGSPGGLNIDIKARRKLPKKQEKH